MANFWENDPIVQPAAATGDGGDWWKKDPIVGQAPQIPSFPTQEIYPASELMNVPVPDEQAFQLATDAGQQALGTSARAAFDVSGPISAPVTETPVADLLTMRRMQEAQAAAAQEAAPPQAAAPTLVQAPEIVGQMGGEEMQPLPEPTPPPPPEEIKPTPSVWDELRQGNFKSAALLAKDQIGQLLQAPQPTSAFQEPGKAGASLLGTTEQIPPDPEDNAAIRASKAAINVGNRFMAGLTTPEMLPLFVLGAAPGVGRAITGAFATDMIAQIPDVVDRIKAAEQTKAWSQERWETAIDTTLNTLFLKGLMEHALLGKVPAAPATAAGAPAAAEAPGARPFGIGDITVGGEPISEAQAAAAAAAPRGAGPTIYPGESPGQAAARIAAEIRGAAAPRAFAREEPTAVTIPTAEGGEISGRETTREGEAGPGIVIQGPGAGGAEEGARPIGQVGEGGGGPIVGRAEEAIPGIPQEAAGRGPQGDRLGPGGGTVGPYAPGAPEGGGALGPSIYRDPTTGEPVAPGTPGAVLTPAPGVRALARGPVGASLPDAVRRSFTPHPEGSTPELQKLDGEVRMEMLRQGIYPGGGPTLVRLDPAEAMAAEGGRGPVALAERLGKQFGLKVTWFRGAERPIREFAGTGGPGEILINVDAERDPVHIIAAHELTHDLQQTTPGLYRTLVDALTQADRAGLGRYSERAIRRGYPMSEIPSERVADFVAETLQDPSRFARALGDKPALAQRVLTYVRDFLDRTMRKLGLRKDETATGTVANLKEAQGRVMDVLDAFRTGRQHALIPTEYARRFAAEEPQAEKEKLSLGSSSPDIKAIREAKNKWIAAGRTEKGAAALVDRWYKPDRYAAVAGPDAVYLTMPSTSGKNFLPRVLAERIAADHGGQIFTENVAEPRAALESKNKVGFAAKLADPVEFAPVQEGLNRLKALGRPVTIVDDVQNTGESAMALRRTLEENGVPVAGIASLGLSDTRLTSPRDLARLSEKLAKGLNLPIDSVRQTVQTAFDGSFKQWFNYFERAASASGTGLRRVWQSISERQRLGETGRAPSPATGAGREEPPSPGTQEPKRPEVTPPRRFAREEVPSQGQLEADINDKEKMRGHIETIQRMTEVSPEVKARAESYYTPTSLGEVTRQAKATVDRVGLREARKQFMNSRRADAETMALGHEVALRHDAMGAQDPINYDIAAEVRSEMARKATSPAQALWFLSTLEKTSPEGLIREAQQATAQSIRDDPAKMQTVADINKLGQQISQLPEGPAKTLATAQALEQLKKVNARGQMLNMARINKLIELNKAGKGLTGEQLAEELSKALKLPRFSAADRTRILEAQRRYAEAEASGDRYRIMRRAGEMMDEVYAKMPRSFWQKLRGTAVISMITHLKLPIRIGISNAFYAGGRMGLDTVKNILHGDLVRMVTPGQKTITGQQIRAFAEGMREPDAAYLSGYREARAEGKGRIQAFGQGMRTMIDLAQMTTRGMNEATDLKGPRHLFTTRFGKLAEDTVGLLHNTIPYAFWNAAYRSSLVRQMRLAGVDMPTEPMVQMARVHAFRAIFQNDTVANKTLTRIRDVLNLGKRPYGLGTASIPFARIPGALLTEGATWSPIGFIRGALDGIAPKLMEKVSGEPVLPGDVVDSFLKAAVGTGSLGLTGYWLAKLGVMTGARDDDPKVENFRQSMGWGAYSLNLSELKRRILSGNWWTPSRSPQQGDVIMNYNWLEPAAIPLTMGADAWHSRQKGELDLKRGKLTANAMLSAVGAAVQSLTDQPLLQGIDQLTKAYAYNKLPGFFSQVLANVPGNFVPSVVRQVSQLVDNNLREMKGGSDIEQNWNRITTQFLPGWSKRFPADYDAAGRAQLRYNYIPGNLLQIFLNPARVTTFRSIPGAEQMENLMNSTGASTGLPNDPSRTITINGKQQQLDNEQLATYKRYVGQNYSAMVAHLMSSPAFAKMPVMLQQKVLGEAAGAVNTAAKIDLFGEKPIKPTVGLGGVSISAPSAFDLGAYIQGGRMGLRAPVQPAYPEALGPMITGRRPPLWDLAPGPLRNPLLPPNP